MRIMLIFIIIVIPITLGIVIKKNRNIRFESSKYQKIIVTLYCFILVVSTIALYLIPQKDFVEAANKPIKEYTVDKNKVYSVRTEENFKDSKMFSEKDKWNFNYSGNLLKISNIRNRNTFIEERIIVERKATNDGEIEVINYVPYSTFNNFNVTQLGMPSIVKLNENELVIKNEENYNVTITEFECDFIESQFLKKVNNQDNSKTSPLFLQKIMYIKIPKNLQIDESGTAVEMIVKP